MSRRAMAHTTFFAARLPDTVNIQGSNIGGTGSGFTFGRQFTPSAKFKPNKIYLYLRSPSSSATTASYRVGIWDSAGTLVYDSGSTNALVVAGLTQFTVDLRDTGPDLAANTQYTIGLFVTNGSWYGARVDTSSSVTSTLGVTFTLSNRAYTSSGPSFTYPSSVLANTGLCPYFVVDFT